MYLKQNTLVRDVLPKLIIQKLNIDPNLNNFKNKPNFIFYYTFKNYGNLEVLQLSKDFDTYFDGNIFNKLQIDSLRNFIIFSLI